MGSGQRQYHARDEAVSARFCSIGMPKLSLFDPRVFLELALLFCSLSYGPCFIRVPADVSSDASSRARSPLRLSNVRVIVPPSESAIVLMRFPLS